MIKVYKTITVQGFHVLQCHRCVAWLSVAKQRENLPEFVYCFCDEQQGLYQTKKKTIYRETSPIL